MLLHDPRVLYFLVKSVTQENVDLSQEHGCWATVRANEEKFARAFKEGKIVVLIFSVNSSSRFSGYGVMTSLPGEGPRGIFRLPNGKFFPGLTFTVRWISRHELNFQEVAHIRNPLNENQPVKLGRDGQPVAPESARAVLDRMNRFDLGMPPPNDFDLPPQPHRDSDMGVGGEGAAAAAGGGAASSRRLSPAPPTLAPHDGSGPSFPPPSPGPVPPTSRVPFDITKMNYEDYLKAHEEYYQGVSSIPARVPPNLTKAPSLQDAGHDVAALALAALSKS